MLFQNYIIDFRHSCKGDHDHLLEIDEWMKLSKTDESIFSETGFFHRNRSQLKRIAVGTDIFGPEIKVEHGPAE